LRFVAFVSGDVFVGSGVGNVLADRIEQLFAIADVAVTVDFSMLTNLALPFLSSVFFVPKSAVSINNRRHAKLRPNVISKKIFG